MESVSDQQRHDKSFRTQNLMAVRKTNQQRESMNAGSWTKESGTRMEERRQVTEQGDRACGRWGEGESEMTQVSGLSHWN